MTDNLTPTTEDVRNALRPYRVHPKEFDMWIAKVKADAWNECLDAIEQHELNTAQAREGNPHRTEAT